MLKLFSIIRSCKTSHQLESCEFWINRIKYNFNELYLNVLKKQIKEVKENLK